MSALAPAIKNNAKILTLFAVACTTAIGLVNLVTQDRIKLQAQKQLIRQLNEIVAVERHDNEMFRDCMLSPIENNDLTIAEIYRARKNTMPIAAALKTTVTDGYNGKITLLIAVNIDGSVSGVRTLQHSETPGLGDKIEIKKSDWITKFSGKKVLDNNDNRWAVVKDGGIFDQFTGATITPRAVVKAVRKTVDYFKENQALIFTTVSNCEAK